MASHLVHATCVALQDVGLLLRGPSGAGKSDLALRLMDGGARLVADDQVLLEAQGGRLIAQPPALLAGKLEVRGIGILQTDHQASVQLRLCADLRPAAQIQRLPEPRTIEFFGVPVLLIELDPFEASAAAKLRLVARGLATLQQSSQGKG